MGQSGYWRRVRWHTDSLIQPDSPVSVLHALADLVEGGELIVLVYLFQSVDGHFQVKVASVLLNDIVEYLLTDMWPLNSRRSLAAPQGTTLYSVILAIGKQYFAKIGHT